MTDKEIEILKKIELRKEAGCKMLECGIINKNIELNKKIIELKKIEEAHRELNGQLRKELQVKEKMIDLMARFMEVNEFDSGILDEYCPDEHQNCRHENDVEGCLKCLKEYFTKKASEK